MNEISRLRLADWRANHGETVATDAGRGSSARVGGEFGADGGSPSPVCGAAGGASASIPGMSVSPNLPPAAVCVPAALFGKARRLSVETRAKIQAAARARYAWDASKIARVKTMLMAGVSTRDICRREGIDRSTLSRFCDNNNLTRHRRQNYCEASSQVLRDHYATNPDRAELLRIYRAARGFDASESALQTHAFALGLKRPRSFLPQKPAPRSRADVAAETAALNAAERAALAPRVQALLDAGVTCAEAARQLGISTKRTQRMMKDGLIVRPVKEAAPPPKPKRKVLPASWVREAPPPPKPRPTYQTVQEWLDAGGQITRLPAAAVHVTTADLGNGREMIRQHAEVMAQDDGNWRTRAKRKMGRFHFGAGV